MNTITKFVAMTIEALRVFIESLVGLSIEDAVKKWNAAIESDNAFMLTKSIFDGAEMEMRATGKKWVVRDVPLNILFVDTYQRIFSMRKINDILPIFDENQVDVKLVNHRDNKFYIVDGWHTVITLMLLGKNNITVKITNNLNFEEEARLFALQDEGSTRVGKVEKFFALLKSGDERVKKIFELCRQFGYKLSRGTKRGTGGFEITAVGTVEALDKSGTLEKAFYILKDSGFENQTEAFNNKFLGAFTVLKEFTVERGDANWNKLIALLKAEGNPAAFVEHCKTVLQAPKNDNSHQERYIQAFLRVYWTSSWKPEYKNKAKEVK